MIDDIRDAIASYQPRRIERDGLARAGVLIAIYDQAGIAHVLLTVRSEQVEFHKGQISFPGGMKDDDDVDVLATALREAEEEIGLRREHVEVWGRLDDIVTISDFLVTPYVGRVTEPAPYAFAPSAIEVAELLAVPLPHLHDPATINDRPATWRDQTVPPPSYAFGEHLIWGATARMLGQFLQVTRGGRS